MSESIESRLIEAAGAERSGDREGALRLLSEVLLEQPSEARAIVAAAHLHRELGQPKQAAECLQALDVAQLKPDLLLDALLLRAEVARDLQMEAEQRAAIDDALALDAYCWPARLMLGEWLEKKGRPKEAARTYRDTLQIAPPPAYRPETHKAALAHAERMAGNYAEALELVLMQSMNGMPAVTDKWREAASIVARRSRPFVSQSNQLSVPRLPAQPFFRREVFPWAPALEARTGAIRAEMLAVFKEQGGDFEPYIQYRPGDPVNQWQELNHSRKWTGFHLIRSGKPVEKNLVRCPATAAALAQVDAVQIAGICPNVMFSVLQPKTRIPPHHGESNARLVAHLPLVVPPNCWFRVGYDYREWKEGEVLIFDDTIEHEAANDSEQLRVVLLFDIWNPFLSVEERALVQQLARVEQEFQADA
jgi:aspartyl/asparaginyl beta-hydroxylase (cupin superfamily)